MREDSSQRELKVSEKSSPRLSQSVSIIIPTFREAEGLPDLIHRLEPLRECFADFEVLIVDDNSNDGTEVVIQSLRVDSWLRLIVRYKDRGLSQSVIEGLRAAKNSILIVMDADLSHPPEVIPQMVEKLSEHGVECVVGSRYCDGGGVEQSWGFFRRVNSSVATLAARPFTNIKDPMSGFIGLRREDFLKADTLNPIGYKIGLELIVKCGFKNVKEVPIFFSDRKKGQSKLSFQEQVRYLRHIKRLADYKFGNFSFFFQFGIVGTVGLVVNLLAITVLNWLGVPVSLMVGLAIYIGMNATFFLNRFFTFNHGEMRNGISQYFQFVAACSLGALFNYGTTVYLIRTVDLFKAHPQIPALVGTVAGMGFNFILSRYVVFRKSIVVQKKA